MLVICSMPRPVRDSIRIRSVLPGEAWRRRGSTRQKGTGHDTNKAGRVNCVGFLAFMVFIGRLAPRTNDQPRLSRFAARERRKEGNRKRGRREAKSAC